MRAPEPYFKARLREIREAAKPMQNAMALLNSRFHYARTVHRSPFDLYWHPTTGVFHLRVTVGRRVLPVPEGALRIGRYDRAARWEDVKADFLAVTKGKA